MNLTRPSSGIYWREYAVELPEHYTINILDQNVSKVEFNETQVLVFNKDNYEVKTI